MIYPVEIGSPPSGRLTGRSQTFLAAACVLLTAIFAVPARGDAERGIHVGDSIPPRTLKALDREDIALPAAEGLTVLVFWATWSPRSEPALAMWQEYQEEYREHGVAVITANADHQHMEAEDFEKVNAFLAEKGISLPTYVDQDLEHFNEIGVIVLPTTLFLRPDGQLVYKMAGFPTSARMDIREDLERELGIAEVEEAEEVAAEAEPAYQPKSNANLYFNMGKQFHQKGQTDKARQRYLLALQKDPDYDEPLRGLEGIFFADGKTAEAEEELKAQLTESGLEQVIDRVGQGEPLVFEAKKKMDPMERMRLLMGNSSGGEGEMPEE